MNTWNKKFFLGIWIIIFRPYKMRPQKWTSIHYPVCSFRNITLKINVYDDPDVLSLFGCDFLVCSRERYVNKPVQYHSGYFTPDWYKQYTFFLVFNSSAEIFRFYFQFCFFVFFSNVQRAYLSIDQRLSRFHLMQFISPSNILHALSSKLRKSQIKCNCHPRRSRGSCDLRLFYVFLFLFVKVSLTK